MAARLSGPARKYEKAVKQLEAADRGEARMTVGRWDRLRRDVHAMEIADPYRRDHKGPQS